MKNSYKNLVSFVLLWTGLIMVALITVSCKEEIIPQIIVHTSDDQLNIENDGYQVAVMGTALLDGQTGMWRVAQGVNGTFDEPSNSTTIFRGEPGELYTLEWEITEGEYYKTSWMNVSFKSMIPVIIGEIPTELTETFTVHLKAEAPKFGATGTWQYDGNVGGVFADSTAAETSFLGQPNEEYRLRWVLTYGSAKEFEDKTVVFDSVRADAGIDDLGIITNGERLFYTLTANIQEGASGKWTLLSGVGGILYADTNPNSLFEGILDEVYTLKWETSHGGQTESDTVQIRFGGQHGLYIDERDGQEYKTIKNGELEWMAENYNYAYDPGNSSWYYGLAANTTIEDGEALMTEEERKRYGRMYTYFGAVDSAPDGWRLPTEYEWDDLIRSFNGYTYAADALIEGGESGLDLTLGGIFTSPWFSGNNSFFGQEIIGYYWSYNPEDPWTSYTMCFNMVYGTENKAVGIGPVNPPVYGFSVRFVREVE